MGADKPMLCTKCLKVHPGERYCPVHRDEPLLDLSDRQVIHFLRGLEDKARDRHLWIWTTIFGVVGMFLGLGLVLVYCLTAYTVYIDVCLYVLAGGIAGGAALGNLVARKTYKPKFEAFLTTDADLFDSP